MLCQTPLTLGGPGGGQQTLRRNPKEILDTRHPTCPSSPSLSPVFALGAQGTERNVSQAVTGLQGQDGGATNCQGSMTPGRGFGSFCLAFAMQVSSQEAVALLTQPLGPSMGQMQGGRV